MAARHAHRLILAVLLAGISAGIGCRTQKVAIEDLVETAKKHVAETHPEWKQDLSLPPVLYDKGSYWRVTFALPDDWIGGTPVVEIDKRTLKPVNIYHEQ